MGSYDLVVVGAGMGGVAAALAASRHHKNVLLVERMYAVGGLATLGLITIYLPLCDGAGRQVCYGLNDELLHLAIKNGYEDKYPDTWLFSPMQAHGGQRFEVGYNAQVFAIEMEQELLKAGCTVLYGTLVVGVEKEDKRIVGLYLENKSGRQFVQTKAVVDATGDADVCVFAGMRTRTYEKKNPLAAWYYETTQGKTVRRMLGASDIPNTNAFAEAPLSVGTTRFQGLDARELSDMMIASHAKSLSHFLAHGEVSPQHSLATIATIPQVRMTRCLIGDGVFSEKNSHMAVENSVGLISDWRKAGPVFEIPFDCLYASSVSNLAVTGRCISVTDSMWDITRVIPPAVATGQAAGTAFALADDLTTIDVSQLQDLLRDDGVIIHEKELS